MSMVRSITRMPHSFSRFRIWVERVPGQNHQVQFFLSAQLSHFLGHAGTHTGCGIRRRPLLHQGKRRISPALLTSSEARKRALRVIFSSIQTDKERTPCFSSVSYKAIPPSH